MSVCYRLLKFRSLDESRKLCDLQTIYHVGLLLFMMTTFLQFNRHRIMNHKLLSLCLRDALDTETHGEEDGLILWFMVVGGIWVSNDVEGNWLYQRIWETSVRRRIDTWDEVRHIVCMFPWIHALHDQPGYELWSKIQRTIGSIDN